MKSYRIFVFLILFGATVAASANGVSQYVPVNVDPVVERDIERLAVYANLTDLTRPYSVALIQQGLGHIESSHPGLHRRLERYLAKFQKRLAVSHAAIAVETSDGDIDAPRVNRRGSSTEQSVALSFRSHAQVSDWLMLSAGGEVSDDVTQASGSLLSVGTSWAQVDIGYKEYWLSPFMGSSQLLSSHAQTLPSVSLSNNLPITFFDMGFNYEFFVAQLSKQPTAFNGGYSDDEPPLLASVHLSFQPLPWWIIGATRNFQFGGGERDVSLSTLAKAFYDPRGADNDASIDEESGNQVASVASKMIFDGAMPFSFNVELAGEDTSNNKNYQLGNPALTAGLFFPAFFTDSLSLVYEYADWDSAWYVNHVYQEGYTNEGFVLGHWAMQDQYAGSSAVPGTSHLLGAQWWTPWRHILDINLRTAAHDSEKYQSAWNVDVDYFMPVKSNARIGLGAFFGQDSFDQSFLQLRVTAQWL
ncbi:MAG TPA: capsule assembly Wzi family protein [Marinagarivorans sp.]